MEATQLFWLAPIGSVMALVYSYYFYASMMKSDPGSEKSQEIYTSLSKKFMCEFKFEIV